MPATPRLRRRACQHPRHAFLARDVRPAELVHDAVAMTFEQ